MTILLSGLSNTWGNAPVLYYGHGNSSAGPWYFSCQVRLWNIPYCHGNTTACQNSKALMLGGHTVYQSGWSWQLSTIQNISCSCKVMLWQKYDTVLSHCGVKLCLLLGHGDSHQWSWQYSCQVMAILLPGHGYTVLPLVQIIVITLWPSFLYSQPTIGI